MYALWVPVRDYLLQWKSIFTDGWNRFWFSRIDTTTVALIRIFVGLILLYVHATAFFEVQHLIGPYAWVDHEAVEQLQTLSTNRHEIPPQESWMHEQWGLSIWNYITNPTAVYVTYGIFIAAILSFTVGFNTRLSNLLVWIGQLSYVNRGYIIWFGMDVVLCMLLLYLLFAPSGATLSVDWLLRRWRAAGKSLAEGRPLQNLPPSPTSWAANVTTRMIQLHMCIIYLCAGLTKLQGNKWWDGTAAWYTMMIPEFEVVPMYWLGYLPDWVCNLIANIGTVGTLAFEISFVYLIWSRLWRPVMLFGAFMLHAGIGLFMGLGGFGAAMLTACAAFVAPATFRWILEVLFKGASGFKFVYDRNNPSQASMARWIAVTDPYGQVEVVDRDASGESHRAGSLITPDGSVLTGMDAFARLFRSLPCLWIAWPGAVWAFMGAKAPSPTEPAKT